MSSLLEQIARRRRASAARRLSRQMQRSGRPAGDETLGPLPGDAADALRGDAAEGVGRGAPPVAAEAASDRPLPAAARNGSSATDHHEPGRIVWRRNETALARAPEPEPEPAEEGPLIDAESEPEVEVESAAESDPTARAEPERAAETAEPATAAGTKEVTAPNGEAVPKAEPQTEPEQAQGREAGSGAVTWGPEDEEAAGEVRTVDHGWGPVRLSRQRRGLRRRWDPAQAELPCTPPAEAGPPAAASIEPGAGGPEAADVPGARMTAAQEDGGAVVVEAPAAVAAAEARPSEEPAPPPDDAQVEVPLQPSPAPGFVERGRIRRRARYLRQLREIQLRDIGGFLVELHRFGQERPELVRLKVEGAARTDAELRTLERALGERSMIRELREAGIGGACPSCGAVHGSDDNFCAACGEPLAEEGAAAQAPPEAAPPAAAPGPVWRE